MGRFSSCAVVLLASLAWADGEPSLEQGAPAPAASEARHAVWLHTGLANPLTGAALAYEHWFSRSLSVQASLGGSYNHSMGDALIQVGGVGGTLGGLPGTSIDTWAVATEVQLRWHLAIGLFLAESLGAQWQRMSGSVDTGVSDGRFGSDSTLGIESVLAGWGHTFDAGLRVEAFAGPAVSLSFAGGSATQMSANALGVNFRYGVGVGWVF